MSDGCATFRTSVGICGIAWRGNEITSVHLPRRTVSETIESLTRDGRDPNAVQPPFVRAAIQKIIHHLAGNPQDLSDIPLAVSGVPAFHRKVYSALRKVPSGSTVTYGELARRAGSAGGARAVGQAMRGNPFPVVVPCHRVVAAGGRPGGFSAYGDLVTKERLLAIEGVALHRKADEPEPLPFDSESVVLRSGSREPVGARRR